MLKDDSKKKKKVLWVQRKSLWKTSTTMLSPLSLRAPPFYCSKRSGIKRVAGACVSSQKGYFHGLLVGEVRSRCYLTNDPLRNAAAVVVMRKGVLGDMFDRGSSGKSVARGLWAPVFCQKISENGMK